MVHKKLKGYIKVSWFTENAQMHARHKRKRSVSADNKNISPLKNYRILVLSQSITQIGMHTGWLPVGTIPDSNLEPFPNDTAGSRSGYVSNSEIVLLVLDLISTNSVL